MSEGYPIFNGERGCEILDIKRWETGRIMQDTIYLNRGK